MPDYNDFDDFDEHAIIIRQGREYAAGHASHADHADPGDKLRHADLSDLIADEINNDFDA
jgi:hypothetical protein